jgi:MFS family permease
MRGLSRTYWFLWSGALINRLGGFVSIFLALYLTGERGLSVAHAGQIVALLGMGSMASGPVGGLLADRLGRRTTMLIALTSSAAAMLQLGFARTPAHIAVATLLLGFCGDLFRPAMQATVADVVPAADRTRAYGYLYWAINLGFAGAAVIAGLVASKAYLALFVVDAATTLAFAVIVLCWIPETHPDRLASRARGSFTAPFKHGRFLAFVVIQLFTAMMFAQVNVALPIDMRAHGISPSQFGALVGLNGVLIVLLQPFVVSVAHRVPRARMLALGALTTGIGFGLTGLASAPLVYGLSIVVWTLGEIALSAVAPAVIADYAPPHLRGSYQGTYQLSWSVASFLGPITGSYVLGHFGGGVLWAGCLAVGVTAALLHLFASGIPHR